MRESRSLLEGERLSEIVGMLLDAAGGIGRELRLEYQEIGRRGGGDFYVVAESGNLVEQAFPLDLWGLLNDLREGMVTPEKGAWFTMSMTVDKQGKVKTTFDYDREPTWAGPTPAYNSYLDEMEWHPRSGQRFPDWFVSRMEEARIEALESDE